jgi:hypothetical protein
VERRCGDLFQPLIASLNAIALFTESFPDSVRQSAYRDGHLTIGWTFFAQTGDRHPIGRVHDLRTEHISCTQLLNTADQQRADTTIAQTNLSTQYGVYFRVKRLAHQTQSVPDALACNYVHELRVA